MGVGFYYVKHRDTKDITKLVMLSLSYSNTLFEGVLDQIEHKKHPICERQVGHSKL